MKNLVIALILMATEACHPTYKELFKEGTQNYELLKQDINGKLSKWNSSETKGGDFDVLIFPVLVNKGNVGVYNYAASGSHHAGNNFFTYDGSTMKILNNSDTMSLKLNVSEFLMKNKFDESEQAKCLTKISRLFNQGASSF